MDYLLPCLVFVWAAYLWETYLQWRQRRVYISSTTAPEELREIIDQETFNKSRTYQLDKSTFSMAHDLFKHIEFLVIIVLGFLPRVWDASGDVTGRFGFGPEYEVTQSIVFLLICLVYSQLINLPWSVYSTFVLEEKHGFNKQTVGFFVKDQVKSFLLASVLLSLIMSGLITVIHWGGEYFYLYTWVFLLIVSLVWVSLYHNYIAPLFDTFTPLPEGELRSAIEGLASSLSFPLTQLLVVEGSKRSAHSNAYFYGFGKNKRIVLFDTLLETGVLPQGGGGVAEGRGGGAEEVDSTETQEGGKSGDSAQGKDTAGEGEASEEKPKKKGCSTDEILAVLAHELGHWKFSHTLKNICIAEVNFFLTLFMFGFFMNQTDMYTSFGFSATPTIIGLIIVFELIFTPYNMALQFLMIQVCRRFEYQADQFAKSLGRAGVLRSALTKLVKDNLSFPMADSLYSAFHHSHPTFLERLRELPKED